MLERSSLASRRVAKCDTTAIHTQIQSHHLLHISNTHTSTESTTDDGTFLVRESHTSDGDYVLSVLHHDEIYHYQIRRHGEDAFFSIDEQQPIHGLDSLVEQYRGAANGLIAPLKAFVRGDQPPHDSRSHGRTNLLHRATREGDVTVVSELLKCGYRNLDAKNQDGQTAVHLATRCGSERIAEQLLASGANVNCRDSEGNTALHVSGGLNMLFFLLNVLPMPSNPSVRLPHGRHSAHSHADRGQRQHSGAQQ